MDSVSFAPTLNRPALPGDRSWLFSQAFAPNGSGPHGFNVKAVVTPTHKLWHRNGVEALEQIETRAPDLILSDVIMPRMSGPQMIQQMHQEGIDIPVVFLSGYTDDRLHAQGFDATKVTLIRKPFQSEELLGCVSQALSLRKSV